MGKQTKIMWGGEPLDWSGETVVIVGSGPSVRATNFELVRKHRVIAINLSWRLAPWADILYGSDGIFWTQYKGVPKFSGRKFTSSPYAADRFDLELVFTSGNNSGIRAIWFAAELGASRIVLVGFDMHARQGSHWHENYDEPLRNPGDSEMRVWGMEYALYRKKFAALDIVNCTPNSALTCFKQLPLNEALNGDVVQVRADQSQHPVVP